MAVQATHDILPVASNNIQSTKNMSVNSSQFCGNTRPSSTASSSASIFTPSGEMGGESIISRKSYLNSPCRNHLGFRHVTDNPLNVSDNQSSSGDNFLISATVSRTGNNNRTIRGSTSQHSSSICPRYPTSNASLASTGGTDSLSTQRMCFKTKHCRFWREGRCTRGSECTYAHAELELRNAPDLSKTKLCSKWLRGMCLLAPAECSYAHGEADRKVTPSVGAGTTDYEVSVGCVTDSLASTLEGESDTDLADITDTEKSIPHRRKLLLGVSALVHGELDERTPTHAAAAFYPDSSPMIPDPDLSDSSPTLSPLRKTSRSFSLQDTYGTTPRPKTNTVVDKDIQSSSRRNGDILSLKRHMSPMSPAESETTEASDASSVSNTVVDDLIDRFAKRNGRQIKTRGTTALLSLASARTAASPSEMEGASSQRSNGWPTTNEFIKQTNLETDHSLYESSLSVLTDAYQE